MRLSRALAVVAGRLVPQPYRDAFVGDLLEQLEQRCRSTGATAAGFALAVEILWSAPSLLRWRLTWEPNMESDALDPFRMSDLTPRATAGRTIDLFRSFYLRALAVFLLVHFPLRIVGHFVRSDEGVAATLESVPLQALLANGVLLVSWTLVEGALLATLVGRRRGREIGIVVALGESIRRFPAFLLARSVFLVGVVLGLVLLVVPGVLFACLFMLHGWLIFDRGLGPVEALRESARLVRSRLRRVVTSSLPVAALTFVWVAIGVVLVAVTLRVTAPVMPIFKVAPFTMTLMESGFVLFTILTGIVYASSSRTEVAA